MPETKVNIVITATDATKGVFASVGKGLDATSSKMQSFSGVSLAAGGALASLGLLVKKSVDEFTGQERVTQKLTTLIKNQKGATDEHVKALKDQASAMQKVTTFGDEAIIAAQAQLATFDLTSESIQKIIPGFLDMVAAEQGAEVGMEGMKMAAQGLGKALIGQTDTLVKQGFIFTDLQKEILKTGTESERLNVINEVMGRTYGGMAEELQKGSGQFIVLKNRISDVLEIIGELFIPVIAQVLEVITPVIEKVGEWIQKNPELAKWIVIITAGMLAFAAAIAPIGFALAGIAAGIGFMASPIGIVVIALASLTAAFLMNYEKIMNGFVRPLIGGLHSVNDAVTSVLSKLGMLKGGKTFAGQALEGLKFLGENLQGRAAGGPVSSGTPYIVGERGPELFVPNRSGNIMPNVNNTINLGGITINNEADSSDFFRKLNTMLGGGVESNLMGVS